MNLIDIEAGHARLQRRGPPGKFRLPVILSSRSKVTKKIHVYIGH